MLVPNRFLFRFEFPLRYRSSPAIDGDLGDWGDQYAIAHLGGLEGKTAFAKVWMGWNETGLFIACRVEGRIGPLRCDPQQFWKGDNLRLCTDTRDTRDIKRASRHCQQFYFMPCGGGTDGRKAIGGSARIHRATEHAPTVAPGLIKAASSRTAKRYTIEGHVPAEALFGFDPAEHRRLGLFIMIEDVELGQQALTVGDELNWHIDPSTWASAALTRA